MRLGKLFMHLSSALGNQAAHQNLWSRTSKGKISANCTHHHFRNLKLSIPLDLPDDDQTNHNITTANCKMKFLKVGRVAIITRGRYAGKKVVIIQPVDSGNKAHPFGHALVAGIERYPAKVTRRMSKTRQEKRSRIKPFVKAINYNHLMPTRYTLELEGLKGALTAETFKEVSQREDAKKNVKKVLEERYTSGKNRWFFTALRF
ncbi:ribosomal L27e protein family-domain-containing protein [Xylaria arbuscula]|nr:ribosomal L27e protein family-domain-containing protein [Xylaria arbuscula]